MRWPTKDEEDLFVTEYIKYEELERIREERESASEFHIAMIVLAISGVAVAGFIPCAWDKPHVWLLLIFVVLIFGAFASHAVLR